MLPGPVGPARHVEPAEVPVGLEEEVGVGALVPDGVPEVHRVPRPVVPQGGRGRVDDDALGPLARVELGRRRERKKERPSLSELSIFVK